MISLTQRGRGRWPTRNLVGTFTIGLCKRYKLTFEETYDDLDWYKLAAIALPNESQAWLVKYRGEQGPGATVYVDAGADLAEAKELLKQALDLTEDDFLWVAPGVEQSAALT